MNYREAVARILRNRLAAEPRAVVLGPGVADPKGIFGTTLEAREAFPGRVLETPVSENMLTGACVGLALEGWKPIFTHARADFSLVSWEHIVNTGAKVPFLHPELDFNVTVRMLVGRGWGQGPVHSQAFHHLLARLPGVKVFYPVRPEALAEHYARAFAHRGVSVVFEPRRLYELATVGLPKHQPEAQAEILTFGDCVLDAAAAARELRYENVLVNVIPIEEMDQAAPCSRLPVVYVDTSPYHLRGKGDHRSMDCWVTPPFTPCPSAQTLESEWYPTKGDIKKAVMEALGRKYTGDTDAWGSDTLTVKGPF